MDISRTPVPFHICRGQGRLNLLLPRNVAFSQPLFLGLGKSKMLPVDRRTMCKLTMGVSAGLTIGADNGRADAAFGGLIAAAIPAFYVGVKWLVQTVILPLTKGVAFQIASDFVASKVGDLVKGASYQTILNCPFGDAPRRQHWAYATPIAFKLPVFPKTMIKGFTSEVELRDGIEYQFGSNKSEAEAIMKLQLMRENPRVLEKAANDGVEFGLESIDTTRMPKKYESFNFGPRNPLASNMKTILDDANYNHFVSKSDYIVPEEVIYHVRRRNSRGIEFNAFGVSRNSTDFVITDCDPDDTAN